MNRINEKITIIHSMLLDIMGDVLQYDLSGDQIGKIQDKKQAVIAALFAMQNTIQNEIKDR